jgi:hypothetical protein
MSQNTLLGISISRLDGRKCHLICQWVGRWRKTRRMANAAEFPCVSGPPPIDLVNTDVVLAMMCPPFVEKSPCLFDERIIFALSGKPFLGAIPVSFLMISGCNRNQFRPRPRRNGNRGVPEGGVILSLLLPVDTIPTLFVGARMPWPIYR